MRDVGALRAALRGELLRRSFRDFAVWAWPIVEPSRALLPSVAFEGITHALQRATDDCSRWAVACPPGVSKSLLASVIYPAWLLLRTNGKARIMCAGYSWELAARDSIRCRALIESPEYQALVRGAWKLREDQNQRSDYWTSNGGRRVITSPAGKATGERVTHLVVDDGLSAADAYSDAKRKEVMRWLSSVLPSRLDDFEHATQVTIGQRLHPEDPFAVATRDPATIALVLPALATETPCEVPGWRDPRKPGEPLFALLGVDALERLKAELGTTQFNAQYMQRAIDDTTSTFRRAWLDRRWTELPRFHRMAIVMDASFKAGKASDYAVIQCWGAAGGDRYLVDQWRRQAGFADTLVMLKQFAQRFPAASIHIEAAANGHAILDQARRELTRVQEIKPQGGKMARAMSVQAIVESRAVVLPANASWLDAFLDEVCAFGAGAPHDDQTDCMVYGLGILEKQSHRAEPVCGGYFEVTGTWMDDLFGGRSGPF